MSNQAPAIAAPLETSTPGFLNMAMGMRRNARIRPLLIGAFKMLQRMGINVTPRHFYWPIPYVAELEKRDWPMIANPVGVDLRLENQLEFLEHVVSRYK